VVQSRAFANPSPTSPGTSGVGSIKGPDFFATDLSLRKYFKLPREGMNLMFQADFFKFQSRKLRFGRLGNATVTLALATSEARELPSTRATFSLD